MNHFFKLLILSVIISFPSIYSQNIKNLSLNSFYPNEEVCFRITIIEKIKNIEISFHETKNSFLFFQDMNYLINRKRNDEENKLNLNDKNCKFLLKGNAKNTSKYYKHQLFEDYCLGIADISTEQIINDLGDNKNTCLF